MFLDVLEENNIEAVFSYSPVWEMFFSMHVLSRPDHHVNRAKWRAAQERNHSELVKELRDCREITNDWTLLIDIPAWDGLRQMEAEDFIVFLRRMNIYEWNKMIQPLGKEMSVSQRTRVLELIKEYYDQIFKKEEPLLRAYLTRVLQKEKKYCEKEGVWKWCSQIHPRLLVGEDRITYRKNREYSFKKRDIKRIYVSVSTFVFPHLWLYEAEHSLEVVKGLKVEQAEDMVPEDFMLLFKALGSTTRLEIIKLMLQGVCTVQSLAERMSVSEAGISKHLKLLGRAGLIRKERNGAYVEYSFMTEMIDFIPYTFYEIMR